jgi:hypothetical protein
VSELVADWDTDFELAVRFFRRRWFDEVGDILEGSQGASLAFDDLDLDNDLLELENAVSRDKLRKLALRGLLHAEVEGDKALLAVEAEPGDARAFVRLISANLAFTLRTDDLLEALVENASRGPEPRLPARALGEILSRARSARRARELVAALHEPQRGEALAAIEPLSVAHDFSVIHARGTTDELGAAVERVLARRSLVPVPWIKAKDATRYVATRRRGGWVTLLGPTGVDRELAQELSTILGPVLWAEKKAETASFARFERGKAVDEQTDPDEVSGALRAMGVTAHDPKAPGKVVSLLYGEYVPEGERSPARLRRMSALGLAFLPPADARKVNARS